MKKITLALSALAVSAAAWAAPVSPTSTGQYVFVPADSEVQATGMFLGLDGENLALTNDITKAVWDITAEYDEEQWTTITTAQIGGKYIKVTPEGVSLVEESTLFYPMSSYDINYGLGFASGTIDYSMDEPDPIYYLSFDMTSVEGDQGDPTPNSTWYCFAYSENLTAESINNQLWTVNNPYAQVIAVAGNAAFEKGAFLAVDAQGALYHTDTFDHNALWDITSNQDGTYTVLNLGLGGYLNGEKGISADSVSLYRYDSPVMFDAYGFSSKKGAAVTSYEFLNMSNQNTGIGIWSLDKGSSFFILDYDDSKTAEDYKTQISAKAVGSAAAGIYIGMFNSIDGSSYAGYGPLSAIANAATDEARAEAVEAAKQSLYQLAVSEMERGFVWKNVRTNQYINYSATAPFVNRFDDIDGFNSLWTVEVVSGGQTGPGIAPTEGEGTETPAPAEITFRIKNEGSGKYIGNSTSGAVNVTENADEAGVFAFAVGTRFNETLWNDQTNIVIRHANSTDNCLNISDNDNQGLVSYNGVDDPGAAVFITTLPKITNENCSFAPRVMIGGEVSPINNYVYQNVKSVQVFAPEGFAATGRGDITLVYQGMEGDIVLSQWDSEAFSSITPIDSVYTETTFGSLPDGGFGLITNKYPCKYYELPLHRVMTEGGFYFVRVSPFMFSVTNENGTFYSTEYGQSAYVESTTPPAGSTFALNITPAAGTVTEITSIGIGADCDFQVNWGGNTESIVVTKDGTPIEGMTYNGDQLNEFVNPVYPWDDNFDGNYFIIPCNLTDAGEYVMTIPADFFSNDNTDKNEETIVTWTIEVEDGIATITNVKVSGAAFDLSGRRVAKPSNGIFIIDGKKVMVK